MTGADKDRLMADLVICATALKEERDMLLKENDFLKKQNLELIKCMQPKRIIEA